MDGPLGESTWAILTDSCVVGSVRFKRTETPGIVEAGIWLARRARRRRLGLSAMIELVQVAAARGAIGVRADTTVNNTAALRVLERLGFTIRTDGDETAQ